MLQLLILLVFAFLSDCDAIPKLPRYVGIGYDVAVGNPKTDRIDGGFRSNIFELTYGDELKTEDGRFLVPDKMVARKRNSCSFSASTQEFTGVSSYQQSLHSLVDVSTSTNGWIFDYSFSTSTEFNSMRESTTEKKSMVFDSEASCEVYSLEMNIFNTPPLDRGFRNAVLLTAENPNDTSLWNDIISHFGTHYVTRAYYGGRMNLQNRLQRTSVQELTAMGVNVKFAAGLSYKVFSGNIDSEVESNEKILNAFDNQVEETKEIYIGGKPPKTGNWIDWQDEVLDAPVPTSYAVYGLSRLISKVDFPEFSNEKIEELKSAFDESLKAYCKQRNCIKPGVDLPFPPNITISHNFTKLLYNSEFGSKTNFEDPIPNKILMNVRKVIIYDRILEVGPAILGMRFVLSDSIDSQFTPLRGTSISSLNQREWDVPNGEHITQVDVYFHNALEGLEFYTNKGTKSPLFGYIHLSARREMFNFNGNLVGIRGFIDQGDMFRTFSFITTHPKYE